MKKTAVLFKFISKLIFVLIFYATGMAHAACTSPAGKEADIIYNSNFSTYQFCNNTNWVAYGGGGTCTGVASYSPTVAANSGYFVMTKSTYNGNLGDLWGADSTCLTELTTNTGWRGYSTANANGQLTASKVHAFLCNAEFCTNVMPLTTYYFANANDSAAGGASFTTDAYGAGPNDSADWGAYNYFNGMYIYWTGNEGGSNTVWQSINDRFAVNVCNDWTDSGTTTGEFGSSGYGDVGRWTNANNTPQNCANTFHLICVVNP